ncbi:MAG: DUF1579 domain-containing protein [Acidobacteriota bacterium]
MKNRCVVFLLVLGALGMSPAWAQQEERPMSAEERAAMDAWTKAATPGEAHAALEPFVGSWKVRVTSWPAPGVPPSTSTGSSEAGWILGKRFVQERFEGEFMGTPFEGLGITGYDNTRKQYRSFWIDNFGTTMLNMTGASNDGGRTFVYTGEMDDVVQGKTVTFRNTARVVDADTHVMEMHGPDASGKEFKMMEIVYSRK